MITCHAPQEMSLTYDRPPPYDCLFVIGRCWCNIVGAIKVEYYLGQPTTYDLDNK